MGGLRLVLLARLSVPRLELLGGVLVHHLMHAEAPRRVPAQE